MSVIQACYMLICAVVPAVAAPFWQVTFQDQHCLLPKERWRNVKCCSAPSHRMLHSMVLSLVLQSWHCFSDYLFLGHVVMTECINNACLLT